MTSVLGDLDRLLATAATGGFLLGRWLRDARALAPAGDAEGAALLEMNARAQVTSWDPVAANATSLPGLWDYANKAWAGLVEPFYLRRYHLYANAVAAAAARGEAADLGAYRASLARLAHAFSFDKRWSNSSDEPCEPVGDAAAVGRELWNKYRPQQ